MIGKVQAVHDEAANEIRFTCTCGNVVRVERQDPFELLSLYQGGMYATCGECGMTSELELERGGAMSMLSSQANELRDRAKVLRQGNWSDGADDAALMEQAADTIEQLREKEAAYMDANHEQGMQLIEQDKRIRELEIDNGVERSNNGVTRWARLFGTPERAAQTFTKVCEECSATFRCRECPLYPIVGDNARESEFLEWLKGDA